MKKAAAFSPGHVTGLFYMADLDTDPLKMGSLGAGFSLTKGVKTLVSLDETGSELPKDYSVQISINGNAEIATPVSQKVLEYFFKATGTTPRGFLKIEHSSEIPQGSGFGSSGAGALSLALAVNHLFDSPLSFREAAQLAHRAEIACRTGLGTVLGETLGGFKVCVTPGAPGIGRITPIRYPRDLHAFFIVFGPFPTSKALSDPLIREKILKAGQTYHTLLKKTPDLENFISFSRAFADEADIYSPQVRRLLGTLDQLGIKATMLMFGDGIFTLTTEEKAREWLEHFRSQYQNATILFSAIAEQGGRVLDERQYS